MPGEGPGDLEAAVRAAAGRVGVVKTVGMVRRDRSSARYPTGFGRDWVEGLGKSLGHDPGANLADHEKRTLIAEQSQWAEGLVKRSASSAAIMLEARAERRAARAINA